MPTLKELYTTIKSLRDMNLPVNDELRRSVDSLEEKIIKDEILPALSEDIDEKLHEVERDLVILVEYHPGEPVRVALTRKVKINAIDGAKIITPAIGSVGRPVSPECQRVVNTDQEPSRHVENITRGLSVRFPDGSVICGRNAIETVKAVIRRVGMERVAALGITHSGYNLVSRKRRPQNDGVVWQHALDGWYVYSNMSNSQKVKDLRTISECYHLGLRIDEGKPEI